MASFVHGAFHGPQRLRELLAAPGPLLAPGAYDALSARIVEAAGFGAVYMTGFGVAASLLGRPDVGLLTQTEMVDQARRIVQAVSIPVIADADTGYGNPINVMRTVQEYEQAGVAAIHLEDQVTPKRCGHMDGKELISAAEMVRKLEAAVAARQSPDFVIIARTDARAVEGLPAALERAQRYRDAGADILFVEAPQSAEEIATIAQHFSDVPLLFNWAIGKTPPMPLERLRDLGFRLIIFPSTLLFAAFQTMQAVADQIHTDGSPIALVAQQPSFGTFTDFIGLPEIDALQIRFKADQ